MSIMNIAHKPPCEPKCPSRGIGCHAGCEKYMDWRRQMDAIAAERQKQKDAVQGVNDLRRERQDWLRARGYKTGGGNR